MKRDEGVIHIYLCDKIREKRKNDLSPSDKLIIKRNDFKRMLGWFNVPAYIQTKVIEEMKQMGLIKIKDKQNIILVKPKKKDDSWFE